MKSTHWTRPADPASLIIVSHTDLIEALGRARERGVLLESAHANVMETLEVQSAGGSVIARSVAELVEAEQWQELNDRFFRTLAFGTGGLRGRTIGRVVTAAERGGAGEVGRPEYPCVGTNAMNEANVARATRGLAAYLRDWQAQQGASGRPLIVIAHDVRHFSHEFAELTARITTECGCDAALFDGPRSTPQLSFAVRQLGAQAGIVITASHNPPHDNGYKVYFEDGAQIVEPHASGIIARVEELGRVPREPLPESARGTLKRLGPELDTAYMERLRTLVLDAELAGGGGLRIVFTPIHGTGGVISVPLLRSAGFEVDVVPEQEAFDAAFPTVKSPNPENAEALDLAVRQAGRTGAHVVIGTDPDCDRVGVAVRAQDGGMDLLTGNQIASLIAYYRVTKLFEQGILTETNCSRAAIIKTVVTTDLLASIAAKHGLRCVETLTGFKYIGQKLGRYERELPQELRSDYARRSEEETREARLQHSNFYVFGGEESYGYSGADFVRDKDGNGSALMFAETVAWAASRGMSAVELLNEVYAKYGYFCERNGSLSFEGAEGAEKIARLAASYAADPPQAIDGSTVVEVRDFSRDDIVDADGETLPKEKMTQFRLADGRRVAVRPSGTEPKIKFYMFARKDPPPGGVLGLADVNALKRETPEELDRLWGWLQSDVERRLS